MGTDRPRIISDVPHHSRPEPGRHDPEHHHHLPLGPCAYHSERIHRSRPRAICRRDRRLHPAQSRQAQISAALVLPAGRARHHDSHLARVFDCRPGHVGRRRAVVAATAAIPGVNSRLRRRAPAAFAFVAQILCAGAAARVGVNDATCDQPDSSPHDLGAARNAAADQPPPYRFSIFSFSKASRWSSSTARTPWRNTENWQKPRMDSSYGVPWVRGCGFTRV